MWPTVLGCLAMNDGEVIGTRGEVLQVLLDDVHAPRLLPYVHPVYDVSGCGEPDARGSCVLLRRKRDRKRDLYLATAAYVIEEQEPAGALMRPRCTLVVEPVRSTCLKRSS
jgi:hypothetical protein